MLNVTCLNTDGEAITHLTQWDIGQSLIINDTGLSSPPVFHFYNQNSKEAYVVSSTLKNDIITVRIPNSLLQEGIPIVACLYAYSSPTSGKTLATIKIPVRPRPKPSGYEYTKDDDIISVIQLKEIIDKLSHLEESKIDKITNFTDWSYIQRKNGSTTESLQDVIDDIMNTINYTAPKITSFTISPTTTSYEIGTEIAANTLSFSWTLNKDVATITFNGNTINNTMRTIVYNSALSTNKTFTLTVSDEKNIASASKTISFIPKVYYGASSKTALTSAEIKALPNSKLKSSKSDTYSITADAGQYGYLCMPTSFGIPKVKIAGFDTELISVGTVSHTNASNYTQNYNVYRTSQTGLGTFSMVVS